MDKNTTFGFSSVLLPVRICSVEGRHCGWGTLVLGRGWGLGCTEEGLHLTVLEELCMECLLKYILKKQKDDE